MNISLLVFYPLVDFLLISFAIIYSYKIYRILEIGQQVYYHKIYIIQISMLAALLSIFIMQGFSVYKHESSVLNVEELKNTIKGITVTFFIFAIIIVFGKLNVSRYVLSMAFLFSLFFVVIGKMALYHLAPYTDFFLGFRKKVLIYGAGALGKALFRELSNSPKIGIIPLGFIDDDINKNNFVCYKNGFNSTDHIKVLGRRQDIDRIMQQYDFDEIYVAISNISNDDLMELIQYLRDRNIKTSFVPNLHKVFLHNMKINKVGEIPIVEENEEAEPVYLTLRRYLDIFFAILALFVFLPIFLAVYILTKLDSKGPVIFKQIRVGKNGKPFEIYKFRTMYEDADAYAINPLSLDDPRITRFGKFLRKTSLDELPQILNVLKGDLSFVGPRPEMPFIVEEYSEIQRERLKILPGITGLWQLSGDRSKPIHENMEYDLYYIKNVSFFLDIAILFETFVFAFRGI